jgi:hypothetical protein
MGIILPILVGVLGIATVYFAFKHVSYHEKKDNQIFKNLVKKTKNKK